MPILPDAVGRHVARARSLFKRDRLELDLDRELQFHIDMLTEQHVRDGLPQAAARDAALRAFGAVARVKDDVRDTWLTRHVQTLAQDVRYGLRNIRRSPGFALLIVLTMALGIGANTAIFSVVHAVLLRPLPYADGDRLVVLRQRRPLAAIDDTGWSYKEIVDYRTHTRSLEGVVEFHGMWFILLGRDEPERVQTGVVSASFFDVLGIAPLFGRTFVEADDAPGAPAVLVLSHAYWQRSFGGDPSVVGRVFQMNDRPHQVVGVLPPVPQYPQAVDVYMPTSACPFRSDVRTVERRDARMMQAFARVRAGVTPEKLQADLDVVAARLQAASPDVYQARDGYRAAAVPLRSEMVQSFRQTLYVLLGTAGFVLLIVCASVANLTLARMSRRERELEIRSLLGASRARLLRQLLTESTLLAVLGGAVGLLLAGWGLDLLVALAARFTPRATEVSIDRTVLIYTLGLSVGTGLLFGAVPTFAWRRRGAQAGDGGRVTADGQSLRHALIVAQVAMSFMLLIGAGLMLRSLFKLHDVDPGFRAESLLTMRIDLNFSKYRGDAIPGFWARLQERLESEPGVSAVGAGGTFPLNDEGPFELFVDIEGQDVPGAAPRRRVNFYAASPDFFSTIGQPLLAGRFFRDTDRIGSRPVAIVNRTMARRHWPGEDAVGRRFSAGGGVWIEIVGVVADTLARLDSPAEDTVYVSMFQGRQLSTNWLVRTGLDPAVMERQVRAALRSLDPDQPVDHFRTIADVRRASLEPPRITATLLGLFALLALVITAAGIGGVVALSVTHRTHEFGVRMALGARRSTVITMVLREGLGLVLIGLAIGMAGALVLTRLLATLLFGVDPTDTVTFLAVSMVLVTVAAAACFVPARRAASLDPLLAMRNP